MKKSFPLEVPGLKPPRVIDSIKSDIRKYIKRERRKKLPEGVDFCDFTCRAGADEGTAKEAHVTELNTHIDTASREQWPAVYIEIVAKSGYRTKKEPKPRPPADE